MSTRTAKIDSAQSPAAIRFRVDFASRCSVGIGKVELLQAIERSGSLSQAARAVGMSYRRAWLLIDSLNAGFDTPVISATVGGSGGGGARLTAFGRELIGAYRGLERRLAALAEHHMAGISAHARAGHKRAATRATSRKKISRRLQRTN